MRKALKFSLFFIILLAAVGLIGGLIFTLTFDAENYKNDLVTVVEEQTGREFSIDGDIRLAPSLLPTLVLERVSLGNPDWAKAPLMLSAGRIETRVALLPLIDGRIAIKRIAIQAPVVNLEIGPDGAGNWQFRQADATETTVAEKAESAAVPALSIDELLIENAAISYRGSPEVEPLTFHIEKLHANPTALPGEVAIDLQARHGELPVRLSGSVGSLQQFMGAQSPYPVKLDVQVGAATGQLKGSIEKPGELQGIEAQLSLSTASLADFNDVADLDWPAVGPLDISATIHGKPDALKLDVFKTRLADSDLSGTASLQLSGQRPALQASLKSTRLNLVPLQPEDEPESARLFSSESFSTAALTALDADIQLSVDEFFSRSINLAAAELKLGLNNGTLTIEPNGTLAGGRMDARFMLDAGRKTPHLEARLTIDQMLPGQLPAFQEEPLIRNGPTDIHFLGRGSGASPAAIAGSWNGELLVKTGKGELLNNVADFAGADLIFSAFQMLNPLNEEEKRSELICGVFNFAIKDGIATAEDGIAIQTSQVNVLGSGIINLKTEAINIQAKPRAREGLGINIAQLGDFVAIGGTIKDPKPVTDVTGALKTAGTVGAAVATGGLSLLAQGLFSRTFATDDPCGVALGKLPTETANPAEPSAEEATGKKTEPGALEKAGDAVKGMFDGLFGD